MTEIGSPAPAFTPPPLPVSAAPRSLFVTVLAWCLISFGAILSVVSVMSLLMVIAGSYGTSHSSLFEGFLVIGVPPLSVVAGIGLLRRQRWAFAYVLILCSGIAVWNVTLMLRGPTPQRTYTSPSGVRTTVLATSVNYPGLLLGTAIALGIVAKLLTRAVRSEFRSAPRASARPRPAGGSERAVPGRPAGDVPQVSGVRGRDERSGARDWRVGHEGRDEMYYEEMRDGAWQRIRVSGEMLTGRAHHVIYFADPQAWLQYPDWARHRRDEIIGRIKSEFRAPDYEYHGDTPGQGPAGPSLPLAAKAAGPGRARPAVSPAVPRSSIQALLVAIALLFALSGVMGWLTWGGLSRGETYLPMKRSSQRRMVERAQEPGLYWASVGIYLIVGVGAFGLGAWGVREGLRLRQSPRARL